MSTKVVTLGLAVLLSSIASSQMVRWPGNGHFYELVPTWKTWLQARDDAASRTYLGVSGHLMTVTSAEEQAFIVNTYGNPLREASLGGFKFEGEWQWVTNEPWKYTNWAPGEPNGADYLAFHGGSFLGSWNDRPNSDTRHYFVEYPVEMIDVLPHSYAVTAGTQLTGTLFELLLADNTYMTMRSIGFNQRLAPDIRLEITGVVPAGAVGMAGLILESAVSTTGVMERIELYDFTSNQWVNLGERTPVISDSFHVVGTRTDPGRFIQAGTRQIRARIGWFDRGAPVRNWLVRVDQSVFGIAFE